MENFSDIIQKKSPDVFIIVTEDEPRSNSYFHSDFLPKIFLSNLHKNNFKYKLIKSEKTDNKYIYTTINNNKINTSIRISVYGIDNLEITNINSKIISMKQNEYYTGACAIYLTYSNNNYCFIATKFLNNISNNLNYYLSRFANLQYNNLYLLDIKHNLIDNNNINNNNIDYIYIIGDLDYVVNIFNKNNTRSKHEKHVINNLIKYLLEMYNFNLNNLIYYNYPENNGLFSNKYKYVDNKDLYYNSNNDKVVSYLNYLKLNDELSIELNNNNNLILREFKEGIKNMGPAFLYPEYKLSTLREGEMLPTYVIDQKSIYNSPSFNNRIIYNSNIECEFYKNYDHGDMRLSPSSGIIGFYY